MARDVKLRSRLLARARRLEAELERQKAMVLAVCERLYVVSRHLSVLAERKDRRKL